MPKAVVLLSGGLDSSTVLYAARREDFEPIALTVDYGQRHRRELEAARAVAARAGVEQVVLPLDLRAVGGSALTTSIEVPKGRTDEAISSGEIPATYVPARNMILLSLALGLAEARGSFDLFVGVNAVDYSGYPDCRPEFIEAFERTANLATKAGATGQGRFRVRAPLQDLSKSEIVSLAHELGVPLELTFSCYDPTPEGRACGGCDSCELRRKGFEAAQRRDPARP